MKLIPKLNSSLAAAAVSLTLAPVSLAQTNVWYQETITPTFDTVSAMASDSAGNVFQAVEVSVDLFSSRSARLTCRTADGELSWSDTISGSASIFAYGFASDENGGVFVAGSTGAVVASSGLGGSEALVTHYDAQGVRSWTHMFGGTPSISANAAVPDGAGGVYIAGNTDGALSGPNMGEVDAWIARYDAAGNQLWISQFGSSEDDRITGATLDSTGGVVVCGTTRGDLAGSFSGFTDAFVARFDSAGALTWANQLGSQRLDSTAAVAADQAGGIYVAGGTLGDVAAPNAGDSDVWFAHYDAMGSQTWLRQLGTSGGETCKTVVSDASGGVFLAGSSTADFGAGGASAGPSWLGHFDATGSETWLTQFGAPEGRIVVDGASNQRGGVYLGGLVLNSPGPASSWVGRYDNIETEIFCSPSNVNSTGTHGKMSASGSSDLAANDVTLRADDLPLDSFGFFVNSQTRDFITTPSGMIICVGAPAGRFIGPGEIQNSGAIGSISIPIDLTAIPQPNGPLAVQPGDTWHFQAWYRDSIGGTATSYFTDGVSVTFQ